MRRSPSLMQRAEDVERGLGDVVRGHQPEAAVERRAHHALLLEDVGERPVGHALREAVAEADVVRQPRAHVGRVGDVRLVGVAGVVLGEDERNLRVRRGRDLDRAPSSPRDRPWCRAECSRWCAARCPRCRSRRRGWRRSRWARCLLGRARGTARPMRPARWTGRRPAGAARPTSARARCGRRAQSKSPASDCRPRSRCWARSTPRTSRWRPRRCRSARRGARAKARIIASHFA